MGFSRATLTRAFLCSLFSRSAFTPLPVSAQIALEPAAKLPREKAGGDVNCKLARMTQPEPTPAEEPSRRLIRGPGVRYSHIC